MLITPQTRVCEGKKTRYALTAYQPFLWLKTNNDEQYTVINIDGFIINTDYRVNGIFKKAEITTEAVSAIFVPEKIFELLPKNELQVLKKFADVFGTDIYTFIWPQDYPTEHNPLDKTIHSAKFSFLNNDIQISSVKKISLNDLERGIKMLRGQSFSKVKPLLSASSNVECYLANNTFNPWPGDLDAVIFDHAQQKFVALIEFKTHNGNTPVEDEHIGKYGEQDWRRFSVLFNLADNFKQQLNYSPKILFIVWGTNPNNLNHQKIKIDLLDKNIVLKTIFLPRPTYNTFSETLFETVIELAK